MGAGLGMRLREWFRGRHLVVVVATVVVGVVAGLAMGLVAGTRRTATAPDRYTAWAGGDPDLLLQQQTGEPLTAAIRQLPGVTDAQGLTFVAAFLRGTGGDVLFRPNPFAGNDRVEGFRVVEGRYTAARARDEFTVNPTMAALLRRRFGAQLGDRIDVVAYSRAQVATNRAFSSGERPAVAPFPVRWVGVVDSPSNFDDDSPSIYYSRQFIQAHPDVGVVQSLIQVRLDGQTDPRHVVQAVQQLPSGADAYPISSSIVSESSRRAVSFQSTALWIVSVIIVLGAAILVVLVGGRVVRRPAHDARALTALGLRSRDLAVERICEAVGCTVLALPISVVVAWWVTGGFPLGALRVFEPRPGSLVDWTVIGVGALLLLALAVGGAMLAGAHDERRARMRHLGARPLLPARGSMPFAIGAHFARVGPAGTRRSRWSLVVGTLGVVGLVGAVVLAASLDDMVHTPARWGVNYESLLGNPYVEADTDIVAPVARTPGVERITAAHIGSLSIDGRNTSTMAIEPVRGALLPVLLHGRSPRHGAEIGLGAEVARQLQVGVGDHVSVAGSSGAARRARVVGIVVTPDAAGEGAAVPFALYRSLNPSATRNVLLVDFSRGAQAHVIDRLVAQNFSPPDALPPPSSVAALRRVLPAPVVLAIVLSVLLLMGCVFLLTLSVRAQRRDFAVLRALGARRGQMRAVVHWEATIVVLAILAIGVPLGIVSGRLVVRELTGRLGIVPGVDVPFLALAAGVVGVLLIANALALMPARRAAQPSAAILDRE